MCADAVGRRGGIFNSDFGAKSKMGGFVGGFVCANFMPTAGRREQPGELIAAGLLSVITIAGFVLSLVGWSPGGMR